MCVDNVLPTGRRLCWVLFVGFCKVKAGENGYGFREV